MANAFTSIWIAPEGEFAGSFACLTGDSPPGLDVALRGKEFEVVEPDDPRLDDPAWDLIRAVTGRKPRETGKKTSKTEE